MVILARILLHSFCNFCSSINNTVYDKETCCYAYDPIRIIILSQKILFYDVASMI